jgi:hypothetical protein
MRFLHVLFGFQLVYVRCIKPWCCDFVPGELGNRLRLILSTEAIVSFPPPNDFCQSLGHFRCLHSIFPQCDTPPLIGQ